MALIKKSYRKRKQSAEIIMTLNIFTSTRLLVLHKSVLHSHERTSTPAKIRENYNDNELMKIKNLLMGCSFYTFHPQGYH
jgi:hypothetical protein